MNPSKHNSRFKHLLTITFVLSLSACANLFGGQDQVCFGKKCVNVEVVQDQARRLRGLQFRESLAGNHGMLFIFDRQDIYSFWMKDTLIPLDMIWLDDLRKVVHIEKNVPPCREDPCPHYTPSAKALYVLEINAHESDLLGLHIGDEAEFYFRKRHFER